MNLLKKLTQITGGALIVINDGQSYSLYEDQVRNNESIILDGLSLTFIEPNRCIIMRSLMPGQTSISRSRIKSLENSDQVVGYNITTDGANLMIEGTIYND